MGWVLGAGLVVRGFIRRVGEGFGLERMGGGVRVSVGSEGEHVETMSNSWTGQKHEHEHEHELQRKTHG